MYSLKLGFTILLLYSSVSYSKDDWFCTEQSSAILGNTIQACGIGIGKEEANARSAAFDAAKAEFSKLCDARPPCNSQQYSVEPKRTTCTQSGKDWKCYRMLEFTTVVSSRTLSTEAPSASSPLLKRRMKKNEVVSILGEPSRAESGIDMVHVGFFGTRGTYFTYVSDRFCNKWPFRVPEYDLDNGGASGLSGNGLRGGVCVVAFDDDNDKVLRLYNFKPEYSEK